MIEEKKLISACSPLAEHLHFETRFLDYNHNLHQFIPTTRLNVFLAEMLPLEFFGFWMLMLPVFVWVSWFFWWVISQLKTTFFIVSIRSTTSSLWICVRYRIVYPAKIVIITVLDINWLELCTKLFSRLFTRKHLRLKWRTKACLSY